MKSVLLLLLVIALASCGRSARERMDAGAGTTTITQGSVPGPQAVPNAQAVPIAPAPSGVDMSVGVPPAACPEGLVRFLGPGAPFCARSCNVDGDCPRGSKCGGTGLAIRRGLIADGFGYCVE